jgi:WD40 repeat protein
MTHILWLLFVSVCLSVCFCWLPVGIEPSPLFSEPAFEQLQQQQQQQLLSMTAPAASSLAAHRADPLLSCSAVLGLTSSRCGVLWLKQAGLLAYTASNTLILLDLATKQQSLLSHHRQSIAAVAASSDGQLVATGSSAAEPAGGYADVAVWDVQRRCLVMLLQQHPVSVEQLSFSPEGAWLVSVGCGRVVMWDVATGRVAAVGAVKQVGKGWLPGAGQQCVTCKQRAR